MNIHVEGIQLMGLYLFLHSHEAELDSNLVALLDKLQRIMFSTLSIEEVEKISDLYSQNVNLFDGHDLSNPL